MAAFIATVVAFAAAVQADASETIRGRIVDERGAAVALAEVSIASDPQSVILTDADGVYMLTATIDTDLSIDVTAPGRARVSWTLADARARNFVIVLPANNGGSDEILVTGRRISSGFAPQRIDKLTILTNPTARSDALLAVANLPSSTNADDSADVVLRGSAAGLSRVFFNDVPLYEVVRGSSIDRVTRGFSVFNPSIVQEVEVYPTNPPAYLANAAAGAVRILPDDSGDGLSSLFVGLTGASIAKSVPLDDAHGVLQLYATATDLAPLLGINPALKDTTAAFRSGAIGSTARVDIGSTHVTLLSVLDRERGRYPFQVSNLTGIVESDRDRSYNVLGLEREFGPIRLKIDGSTTFTSADQRFAGTVTRAHNRYAFMDIDLAGQQGAVRYRLGVAGEQFDFRTTTSLDRGGADVPQRQRDVAAYAALYAYATVPLLAHLTVATGVRQPVHSNKLPGSVQASIAYASANNRHRLIFGLGRYGALIPPEAGSTQPIAMARSSQISLDYYGKIGGLTASAGLYRKQDWIAGVTSDINGLDLSLSGDLTRSLSAAGSFTTVRSRRRATPSYPDDNDLGYLLKFNVSWVIPSLATLNVAVVARSGTHYTSLLDISVAPGSVEPIFSSMPNDARLEPFRKFDINLVRELNWWPGKMKPIGFISISNAFDQKNQSSVAYSTNYSEKRFRYYERRTTSLGVVFRI